MLSKILKNSSYLLAAQSIAKVIAFFYTIFLAGSLGVENYGFYTVALAYFSLVSSVSDFGVSRFLIREVSKDRERLGEILMNVMIWRIGSTLVVLILAAIFLSFYDPVHYRSMLSILAILAVLPQSIALTLDGVFVAFQKLSASALGVLVLSFSSTITGFWLVKSGWQASGALYALVVGEVVYALFLLLLLFKENVRLRMRIRRQILREVVVGSLPYGLLSVLALLYFKIDAIMLSYIRGSYETGIYGAAYKFFEAITFVPSAVTAALFPVLAALHDSNKNQVKRLYFQSLGILGILSIFVTIGYLIILPIIIKMFLPDYLLSINAIKILALTIPFMFLHLPATVVLLSTDKYLKIVLKLSVVTLAFNVILNLIFIPKSGYIAASVVTVLSEAFSFIIFFTLLMTNVFRDEN